MARNIPPKPIPKPGHVRVVRALYKYSAQQPDELSFEEDDTLYILDTISDPNWWKAKCDQRVGLIPSNYVEDKMEFIDFPLHDAAKRGNMNFLSECLQNKVSVNSLDKSRSTALHWASHGGHFECAKALLDIPNIALDVQNKLGDTPLHAAAWKGHPEIVKLLLDKGASCFITNNESQTPLQLAREPQVAAILQYACDNNPRAQDEYDLSGSDSSGEEISAG